MLCYAIPVLIITSFSDINECADNNGDCQDKCVNTKGGYRCECKDGTLHTDGFSCIKGNII